MLSIGDDCYWELWFASYSGIIREHKAPRQVCVCMHIMFQRLEDDCSALLERSVTDVCIESIIRHSANQTTGNYTR